jgi:hypothetical protein
MAIHCQLVSESLTAPIESGPAFYLVGVSWHSPQSRGYSLHSMRRITIPISAAPHNRRRLPSAPPPSGRILPEHAVHPIAHPSHPA